MFVAANEQFDFDNEGGEQLSGVGITFLQPCIERLDLYVANLQDAKIRAFLIIAQIEEYRDHLDIIRKEVNEMRKNPSLRRYIDLITDIRDNIMAACDELSLAVEKFNEDERFDHLRNAADFIEKGTDCYYWPP